MLLELSPHAQGVLLQSSMPLNIILVLQLLPNILEPLSSSESLSKSKIILFSLAQVQSMSPFQSWVP